MFGSMTGPEAWVLWCRKLEDSLKAMQTLLPLVSDLHHPAMRPRHWKQLMKVCIYVQSLNCSFLWLPSFTVKWWTLWDLFHGGQTVTERPIVKINATQIWYKLALWQATCVHFVMDESFSLGDLMRLGLHQYVDSCNEIVDRAAKELTIENALKKIEDTWSNLSLAFTPYQVQSCRASWQVFEAGSCVNLHCHWLPAWDESTLC